MQWNCNEPTLPPQREGWEHCSTQQCPIVHFLFLLRLETTRSMKQRRTMINYHERGITTRNNHKQPTEHRQKQNARTTQQQTTNNKQQTTKQTTNNQQQQQQQQQQQPQQPQQQQQQHQHNNTKKWQGHVAWGNVLNTSSWTLVCNTFLEENAANCLDSQACSMFIKHSSWTGCSNTLWLCPSDPGSQAAPSYLYHLVPLYYQKIPTTRRSRSKARNCNNYLFILTLLWFYTDIPKNVEPY